MKAKRKAPAKSKKVTADTPLLPREVRFIDAFLIDPHNQRAAIKAGYDPVYAKRQASRIRHRPNVAAELRRRAAEATAYAKVGVIDVITGLKELAFSNVADFLEEDEATGLPKFKRFNELTRRQMAAVGELTIDTETKVDVVGEGEDKKAEQTRVTRIRFKLANKRDALVDLGRYLKMFIDNKPIVTDDPRTALFSRTLSAVDAVVADAIAEAARRHGERALPNGPLLPVEVLPPPA